MKNTLVLILLILASSTAWSHGEDKPGPHGGHNRMPGAFHTELLIDKDSKDLMVFLTDMEFKNPTVKNSSVQAWLTDKKNKTGFKCSPMGNHFHCVAEKKYKPQGKLTIKAIRENAVGNEAIYELPLPLLDSTKKDSTTHHH